MFYKTRKKGLARYSITVTKSAGSVYKIHRQQNKEATKLGQ
jgi:hypothetical protein